MKQGNLRRVFIWTVNIAFRFQQTLVFLCFLCFVLGFLFSLECYILPSWPVFETTACFSALLLLPLEILFFLVVPVKLFTNIEELSWTMLLTTLLDPAAAFYAASIFYSQRS